MLSAVLRLLENAVSKNAKDNLVFGLDVVYTNIC